MTRHITTEELRNKIDSGERFYLIDVLMSSSFEKEHIPTAKNLPFGEDFIKKFEEKIAAPKDAEIIVYCFSNGCQLSDMAANALENAGYTNVGHYSSGLAGWQSAGYKFE